MPESVSPISDKPLCGACIRDDHEACHVTVMDPHDGQWTACECRCGGGHEAWVIQ